MSDLSSLAKPGELGDEFDLRQLQTGDELRVVTQHTEYVFTMLSDRSADLTTSRPDRPRTRAKIMGCAFGQSSSIKPDHLFCGGNLEFTYELNGQAMTHTTTGIKAISLRRQQASS